MLIPIRTDSALRHTPWMNWGLIAANILMFGAQQVFKSIGESWHLSPSQPRIWNFLTYAFLHANSLHLLGNMLFLYIFGNNVNDKMGHLGYLAFYLAGAVFSGLGFVVLSPGNAPVVGASGAVSAVTGAYLVLFPRATVTVVYLFF